MENVFEVAEKYINDENILEYLMYMGEKIIGNKHIYLYKHIDTRKYINIDEEGNFYKYNCYSKEYIGITKEIAILDLLK